MYSFPHIPKDLSYVFEAEQVVFYKSTGNTL